MDKLKKKIFWVLYTLLTCMLCIFIILFTIQNYNEQKRNVTKHLEDITQIDKKNQKYLDQTMYVVLLNENNQVTELLNLSNQDMDEIKIKTFIQSIHTRESTDLFKDYSYVYEPCRYVILLDNQLIQNKLMISMIESMILFVLLEIVIILIINTLTKWLIQPVQDTFNTQKQFIQDASHELKTPLSVIITSSEALQENPDEKKWIQNIQNEANRMSVLVNDLLKLATSEEIKNFHKQKNDLSKVIELSVLTFEAVAYEKNRTIKEDIQDHIEFHFDENAIKQLIEILLDNAISHSYENSEIHISLKQKEQIELMIENEGEDIPKGEEEKIFERFYRMDASRNRNDNHYGLGLSIAKNIVEQHNGRICAYSNHHKTTFKVIF